MAVEIDVFQRRGSTTREIQLYNLEDAPVNLCSGSGRLVSISAGQVYHADGIAAVLKLYNKVEAAAHATDEPDWKFPMKYDDVTAGVQMASSFALTLPSELQPFTGGLQICAYSLPAKTGGSGAVGGLDLSIVIEDVDEDI